MVDDDADVLTTVSTKFTIQLQQFALLLCLRINKHFILVANFALNAFELIPYYVGVWVCYVYIWISRCGRCLMHVNAWCCHLCETCIFIFWRRNSSQNKWKQLKIISISKFIRMKWWRNSKNECMNEWTCALSGADNFKWSIEQNQSIQSNEYDKNEWIKMIKRANQVAVHHTISAI